MKRAGGIAFFDSTAEMLDPRHTALLVVDMQNDFCAPAGHFAKNCKDVSRIAAMVPNVMALVAAARLARVPVFFTLQTTLPNGASDSPAWTYFKTRDGKSPEYTIDGSWGQQLIAELAPAPEDVLVKKHRPSSFLGTSLDGLLRARGVQTLLLCGCLTQGCVMATAIESSARDYYTILAEDCIQSTNQDQHRNALTFLGSRFDLVTLAGVRQLWTASEASSQAAPTLAGQNALSWIH